MPFLKRVVSMSIFKHPITNEERMMEYKFYKVTEGAFIERVTNAIADRENAIKQLQEFKKESGASGIAEYQSGGVAYFEFDEKPCMKLWKKDLKGFMPRRGTKEGKLLSEKLRSLPSVKNIQDSLDVLKLDNMMVFGESTGRGVRLHSASFCGKQDKKTYFIKVPQEKGQEYIPASSDLVECKEWEVLKFMDEK